MRQPLLVVLQRLAYRTTKALKLYELCHRVCAFILVSFSPGVCCRTSSFQTLKFAFERTFAFYVSLADSVTDTHAVTIYDPLASIYKITFVVWYEYGPFSQ